MPRKTIILIMVACLLSLMQGRVSAGELALEVTRGKKHSAARHYLSGHGTGLRNVDANDFGLPQGPAFLGKIYLGRSPHVPLTMLFTSSKENKTNAPDELRVALGKSPDLSAVKPFTTSPAPSAGQAQPWAAGRQPEYVQFNDVQCSFTQDGQEYPVTIDITCMSGNRYARYDVKSVRAGQVELDGKMVHVLLIDRNANGLFDDTLSSAGSLWGSDVLLIDVNGNGRLDRLRIKASGESGREAFPLTPLLQINSRYYSLQLPPSGATLTLKPVEPTFGRITTAGANLRITLAGPICVDSSQGTVRSSFDVPVGKYSVLEATETRQDSSGRKWTLQARSRGGNAKPLDVQAGQTVSLSATQIIKVGATIDQLDQHRRRIAADFLTDQGLGLRNIMMGNKSPEAPTYEIRDSSGRLIASGKLEYG